MPLTRNQESRINEAAIVRAPRSKFDYGQDAIFDFKMKYIIPFFCDTTVMPGDQFKLDMNIVCRLANPLVYPIMTPLYLDVYAFFVPDRLIWDHIKEFYGENPDGAWTLTTEYIKPKLKAPSGGFTRHSIVDYIYGCGLGKANMEVDARPIRSMNQIYNDWFRNQAVIAPVQFEHGDTTVTFDDTDSSKGGTPYKIAKYGDLYTRSLPTALKGDSVTIPMGTSAPVIVNSTELRATTQQIQFQGQDSGVSQVTKYTGKFISNGSAGDTGWVYNGTTYPLGVKANASQANQKITGASVNIDAYTDLAEATAAGMNNLIEAMAIYDILYRMGIGGTRYTEIIRTFWGVTASDARLQRSEYLGGFSIPIDMTTVPQTSASSETSPQGQVAAFSNTVIRGRHLLNKGFVEHGTILIMLAVRQRHYYSQGIERCYTTFRKFDNYMPPLANLGPMEVKKKELYYANDTDEDEETFGFQEAWYWLRGIRPSKVMGDMRPDAPQTLAAWHLADNYQNAPVLSQDFIEETDENLQRVISVQDSDTQFIATTFVYGTVTRVMPTASIPALRTFF